MREPAFLIRNRKKWEEFEQSLNQTGSSTPDRLADLYIQVTDDLSYARTHYPGSQTAAYLNQLAVKIHRKIYKNKSEPLSKIFKFWRYELPKTFYKSHRELLVAFIIFAAAILIGAFSSANDDDFVRLVLGDYYVNMTLDNIENGDPMAVYKGGRQMNMWAALAFHNIKVALFCFIFGMLTSVGTSLFLAYNGIMVGAFQYFFYQQGLLITSFSAIWIHGALEISAIVIAGCAGIVVGNSILFPKTYSRTESLKRGLKQGVKIMLGVVPILVVAGFLEGFITRLYQFSLVLNFSIIILSFSFIIYYFVIYPIQLNKR